MAILRGCFEADAVYYDEVGTFVSVKKNDVHLFTCHMDEVDDLIDALFDIKEAASEVFTINSEEQV